MHYNTPVCFSNMFILTVLPCSSSNVMDQKMEDSYGGELFIAEGQSGSHGGGMLFAARMLNKSIA